MGLFRVKLFVNWDNLWDNLYCARHINGLDVIYIHVDRATAPPYTDIQDVTVPTKSKQANLYNKPLSRQQLLRAYLHIKSELSIIKIIIIIIITIYHS